MSGDLLCGHWTYFALGDEEATARCDLDDGHEGLHKFWWSPETFESVSWSDSYERHYSSGSQAAAPRRRDEFGGGAAACSGGRKDVRDTNWCVVDHDRDDAMVRGPFQEASTAAAVRTELERRGDERNLWIIPTTAAALKPPLPDPSRAPVPAEPPREEDA